MNDNSGKFRLNRESPLFQLFVSLLIIAGVGMVLSLIFVVAGVFIFNSDLTVLDKAAATLRPNDEGFIRYLLIMQDITLFIIPSIIIMILLRPGNSGRLPEAKIPGIIEIALVLVLAFCIFPISSFTGQINSAIHLPDAMKGLETWITEKEEKADNLIEMMISSRTFWSMVLNLVTIALMPAIAEEMIFRGVFQKIFGRLFRSDHIAVWVTAIIFSAVHFQFYGFIPRLILGLVFGYLFLWSGTLWLPVIAHFVNNAFPVILAYVQGIQQINAAPDVSLLKQAVFLPVPVTISLIILYYFRNKSKQVTALVNKEY
jgi:uncharacterized protein